MASPLVKIASTTFGTTTNIPYGTLYSNPLQGTDTLTCTLQNTAGVSTWSLTVISCSDNTTVGGCLFSGSGFSYGIVTATGIDAAWIIQSQINGGINSSGQVDSNLTYQFKVQQTSGRNYLCYGESQENSLGSGWINMVNRELYNKVPSDPLTTGTDCIMNWDCSSIVQSYSAPYYTSTITDTKGISNLAFISTIAYGNAISLVNTRPYGKASQLQGQIPMESTYGTGNNQETLSAIIDVNANNSSGGVASAVVMGRFKSGTSGAFMGVVAAGGIYSVYWVNTGGTQSNQITNISVPKTPHLLSLAINYTTGNVVLSVNGNTSVPSIVSSNVYATPSTGYIWIGDTLTPTGNITINVFNARYHNTYNPPSNNPRFHQIMQESTYI